MERSSQLTTLSVFPLQLKNFFGYNKFKKSLATELTEDQIESNTFMIDQEIESMQSILDKQELVVYDAVGADLIQTSDEKELSKLKKLVKLSLAPQSTQKFHIVDDAKGINLELRCLPPIEIFILLPDSYPSNAAPLYMIAESVNSKKLFYEPMCNFLYERLNERWSEDMIVLYDIVILIKDDFINGFLESDAFTANGKFKANSSGQIEIHYSSGQDFQKVYDDAMAA